VGPNDRCRSRGLDNPAKGRDNDLSSDSAPMDAFCLDAVRRADHDRYLSVLFAPAERRPALLALYAFNLEIARARESVSQPTIGLIRLQWWQDCLDQIFDQEVVRRHPVAEALAAAIARHGLPRAPFDRLLVARERDMEPPPPDRPALIAYAEGTTAPLLDLAAQIAVPEVLQDETTRAAIRSIAIGYALTGLLRAIPFHAASGRTYLPVDEMNQAELSVQDLIDPAAASRRGVLIGDLAAVAKAHLDEGLRIAQSLSPGLRPVLLTGTIARVHLRRLERAGFDPRHPAVQVSPPWLVWSLMLRALIGRI
jgi:NADH dehydrogenase [ubiquinone] 1 alpha subcomplex assembly factor 6